MDRQRYDRACGESGAGTMLGGNGARVDKEARGAVTGPGTAPASVPPA